MNYFCVTENKIMLLVKSITWTRSDNNND